MCCRFNEAEAIKPRNQSIQHTQQRRRRRFNEAEAIKPRNQLCVLLEDALERYASMRPRQSSLGIPAPQDGADAVHPASMRPRQSSLGIG